MEDNQALVSISKSELQTFAHDRQVVTLTRPPLFSEVGFVEWRRRFKLWVIGWDAKLLPCYEIEYTHPKTDRNLDKLPSELDNVERPLYEAEMKAFAVLTQALTTELSYMFDRYTKAATLWHELNEKY